LVRFLLEVALPFLAPFLAFFAYRLLVTRGRFFLEHTPWYMLIAFGILLAISSLVSFAFTGGFAPEGTYVPPHVEDGRIVPGEVRPKVGRHD
jgi:hypothetical protein